MENRFTGWTDVGLTEKGKKEAHEAARLLQEAGFTFDVIYTSVLKRGIDTTMIVVNDMKLAEVPILKSWRLNERHYGALQGLNKKETVKKYGEEKVFGWRRGYPIRPPALEETDKRHPKHDLIYNNLKPEEIPACESLKDTLERVMPYWNDVMSKDIKEGKKVLISAHGNSLRALIKHLDNVSEEEITKLNIPTGIPLIYELNDDLKPIRHYYLGDEEATQKAIDEVKHQG